VKHFGKLKTLETPYISCKPPIGLKGNDFGLAWGKKSVDHLGAALRTGWCSKTKASGNFQILPELRYRGEKFKTDLKTALLPHPYGQDDALLRAFVSLVHHEQFLAGSDRSLHGNQSAVCIDLDRADVLMERVVPRVAVDE
jgi:hypothetical protein